MHRVAEGDPPKVVLFRRTGWYCIYEALEQFEHRPGRLTIEASVHVVRHERLVPYRLWELSNTWKRVK